MSYLSPPRLHFAGCFQASPSTVNNDRAHFDNAHFKPEYQLPGKGATNGWWNPRGDGGWRLHGCKITSAILKAGSASQSDPVLRMGLADTDGKVSAKIADLDPDMQGVSTIFGLEIRIVASGGETLLRGNFEPAAFTNIWVRCAGAPFLGSPGATFQSILSDLEWKDVSASSFLSELKSEAGGGLLSVKFNVDGFCADSSSNEFCRGRIVGTIGVASPQEPKHFCLGRHFLAFPSTPGDQFIVPVGKINHAVGQLDETARKIRIDLGNSLPTETAGGSLAGLGVLTLGTTSKMHPNFGKIPYQTPGWYETTAGVVDLPLDRSLTDAELDDARQNQLVLLLSSQGAPASRALPEAPSGLYVRADVPVFRLSPDQTVEAKFYATRFGKPEPKSRIMFFSDPNWADSAVMTGDTVAFEARIVTDDLGQATLNIVARNPNNPRTIIDGQVFAIRYALEETLSPALNYPLNVSDCLTLLVWDKFTADDPPTWYGCLEHIFKQYESLYPVMDRFLKLGNYEDVCSHREILKLGFSLPVENPNSMPVTRDLSPAKRKAIREWLTSPGSDGKPLLGVKKPQKVGLVDAATVKTSSPSKTAGRSGHGF